MENSEGAEGDRTAQTVTVKAYLTFATSTDLEGYESGGESWL